MPEIDQCIFRGYLAIFYFPSPQGGPGPIIHPPLAYINETTEGKRQLSCLIHIHMRIIPFFLLFYTIKIKHFLSIKHFRHIKLIQFFDICSAVLHFRILALLRVEELHLVPPRFLAVAKLKAWPNGFLRRSRIIL